MEELKYFIEDRILAELLGAQNFINKESAVLELVKNAFDANSPILEIIFTNNSIIISDTGIGMDRDDIKRYWMHVGESNKGYKLVDKKNNSSRILAGEKGIGRFALARLGAKISIFSKKRNSDAVLWKTDWNKSTLEITPELKKIGTKIIIEHLRDKWTKAAIENLGMYLNKTYNDNVMRISIRYNDNNIIEITPIFLNPKIGRNYSACINLGYCSINQTLRCSVISDEFKDFAKIYTGNIDINRFECVLNMYDILEHANISIGIENLREVLIGLGDFSAEFYFGIEKSTHDEFERFLYKRLELPEKYKIGVVLYRNSFSLSSYDGKRDWLELGKRSRKSPAAATHPTGNWRVRENQISGKVLIDKKANQNLRDLSNRQGLEENKYYEFFIAIIQKGLQEFESYRQSIIRKINEKNKEPVKEESLFQKIIGGEINLNDLDEEKQKELLGELTNIHKTLDRGEEVEKRYKYDVRILNVLATLGLKASSIAHEVRNDKNAIESNYEFIVNALNEYNLWDILSDDEHTKYGYANIPELLLRNKTVNKKIVAFMNTMLDEVEKKKFFVGKCNLYSIMKRIANNWEKDYSWISIDLIMDESDTYILPEDIINVIFDNLILNTIQQNEMASVLKITIGLTIENECLKFRYSDNGIGLHKKYLNNPLKILEVHETTRENGHGLGMWIVNNTIEMSGGEILNITSHNGFQIDFLIGGNIDGRY